MESSTSQDDPTVVTGNFTTQPSHASSTQWQMHSMHHPQHSLHHVVASATIQDPTLVPEYALHCNAFNPDTGKLAKYSKLSHSSDGTMWQASNATKIPCLAQGHGKITGTNTMFFILVLAIPHNKKVTYLCIMCAHHPEKEVPHRICWNVGGDHVKYDGNVSTKSIDTYARC